LIVKCKCEACGKPFEAEPVDRSIHRLKCGDSTSADDVGQLLQGQRPALMATDPPYGVKYDSEWRHKYSGGEYSVGTIANDDRSDWTDVWKLWAPPVLYVWHGGLHARSVAANLEEAGYELRAQIIWNKSVMVFGRGHYHWKHEPCWYAVKIGETATWAGDRSQHTVWDCGNGSATGRTGDAADDFHAAHISQKPVELFRIPMRNHTAPGDLVAEPFAGSGSQFVAAEQLGRLCYGVELEPKYVAVILERLVGLGLEPERQ
jgi:DNA modification methylase